MQKNMLEEEFIQAVHALTGVSTTTLRRYAETGDILHVLEHPAEFVLSDRQMKKVNQINALINSCSSLRAIRKASSFSINSIDYAVEFVKCHLAFQLCEERVVVLYLDAKCHLLRHRIFKSGEVDYAIVPISQILKEAILTDCKAVLVAHNHPSTDATPSDLDIETAKNLREALRLCNKDLIDSIVVGGDSVYSLMEHNDV